MAGLQVDVGPGDIVLVPPDSGAKIQVLEKSGRKAKLSIESAKPVQVLKAKDAGNQTPFDRPTAGATDSPLARRPTAR